MNGKRSGVAGWEFVHLAVDDATGLAYAEVLPNEQGPTAAGFLHRAVGWFALARVTVPRILSDNGSCYRSHTHATACRRLGIRHSFTRPYRPRTNGKAERFIQTLSRRCLRRDLRHLYRTHHTALRMAHPLQLHPTTRLPQPPPARPSPTRTNQPAWELHLGGRVNG